MSGKQSVRARGCRIRDVRLSRAELEREQEIHRAAVDLFHASLRMAGVIRRVQEQPEGAREEAR